MKFVGEIVELETDSAWGQMNFFRRTSHAGGIHDGEEEVELVYKRSVGTRLRRRLQCCYNESARNHNAFYTRNTRLQKAGAWRIRSRIFVTTLQLID